LSDHIPSAQTSRLARSFFWIFPILLLAVPAVLAELYLRAIGLGDPIPYKADSAYRNAPRPNQKHVGRHGAAITLDRKGLRGTKEWTAPDAKIALKLQRPFTRFGPENGFASNATVPEITNLADVEEASRSSPTLLYEDDRLLGSPHSRYQHIVDEGRGAYSHWKNSDGFVFSTSDGTNPNTSGRTYWAEIPR
jgi:hypothetical protein